MCRRQPVQLLDPQGRPRQGGLLPAGWRGVLRRGNSARSTVGSYKITIGPGDDPEQLLDRASSTSPTHATRWPTTRSCSPRTARATCTSATPRTSTAPSSPCSTRARSTHPRRSNALATQFPDTAQLVVTGESAGSVPTPLYAGLAHDLLPNAEITVLADGSGAYPDVPAINAVIGALWGTEAAIPPWPENAGLTAATWSFPACSCRPTSTIPRSSSAATTTRSTGCSSSSPVLAGIPADDLVTLIDQQRDADRAGRCRPAQLHRPGQLAHGAEQPRLLHRDGRRGAVGRLGQRPRPPTTRPRCALHGLRRLIVAARCRRPRDGRGDS